MIQIDDVNKSIKGKIVLKNITYTFHEGTCYLLQGTNGSGKTMLLRLLCGLINPDRGNVIVPKGTRFGVIIETPTFMEQYTAWENLEYLAEINKLIDESDITHALEMVHLLPFRDKRVKTFSLGMKQRLAVCQAIMENPDVLLLDEPFNALDKENCTRVRKIIEEYKTAGKIVVVAAHMVDSSLVSIFDETITIENGGIVDAKH